MASGSSPLARGLLENWPTVPLIRRIIPARAGFTLAAWSAVRSMPDHPRSRGVYTIELSPSAKTEGSSPLARGLLHLDGAGAVLDRIIPARAGFTGEERRPRHPHPDHPRSRGVYGSGGCGGFGRSRIIPARAGFTEYLYMTRIFSADHPRSRGVYRVTEEGKGTNRGSSPLARGLLASTLGPCLDVRIIPARAGFTTHQATQSTASWDHPRSRGVYNFFVVGSVQETGSSPLARGLQLVLVPTSRICWIIPARAGFTV